MRRDEEQARIAEQNAERRGQDQDAADRLRLLRDDHIRSEEPSTSSRESGYGKRKREVQEEVEQQHDAVDTHRNYSSKRARSNQLSPESAMDKPAHRSKSDTSGDPLDQISNMRFRDAAGRGSESQRPWYNALSLDDGKTAIGRDVWGNEDAGRQERDQKRLDANDPLLAMKKGVKQLKETEKQKAEWRRERERDLHEVEELARKASKHRHKHRHKHDRNKHFDSRRDRDKHHTRRRSRSPER